MPNMSVGGLVSGLDTATIISQLMQLEARPQTMLRSKVSNEQKVVAALQALNTKLASIATKAADLAKSTGLAPTKATSDNVKVLVAADPGASTSSIAFTVNAVATAAGVSYAAKGTVNGTATDNVMTAGVDYTVTYNDGRTAETINTGDGSLQDIADAINGTNGLRATLVRSGLAPDGTTPTYELQVVSTATGMASDFTISETSPADPANPVQFMGGTSNVIGGTNAKITLSGQAVAMEFSSNAITDLMPGVDVTLLAGATGSAAITVERDVAKLTESVKAMVDSVNAALSEIGTLTAYDAATKKAGLLGGDSTLRSVRNQLIESVSRGLGGESLAAVGIEVDRYGKLTFDEAKFESAYAADPAKTVAQFAGTDQTPVNDKDPYDVAYGLADRLKVLGEAFSKSTDGTITKAIQSRQSAIKGMEDDIADWDIRLETRRTTLQRQYTALETALGKLQSQGNWLAGQLASLPTMSSGM